MSYSSHFSPAQHVDTFQRAALTCDMQEESRAVKTQRVLRQRGDTEYSRRLVDMFDPLLGPAQVGVGHSCAVAKIQLDVSPQRVTLKHSMKEMQPHEYHAVRSYLHMKASIRKATQNQLKIAFEGLASIQQKQTKSVWP